VAINALPETLSPLGEAALTYALRGWPVFPLAPGSKVPLKGSAGFKDATTEEAKIRLWWRNMPNANIGIACAGHLVVLDIDRHDNDGFASLTEFERTHGKLPPTMTSVTPNNGEHRVYLAPDFVAVKNSAAADLALAGIDIRGKDGYIVAPPSVVDGKAYCLANDLKPVDFPLLLAMAIFGVSGRNDYLAKVVSPRSRNQGVSGLDLLERLQRVNAKFAEPLSEGEVRKIASSADKNYSEDSHFADPEQQTQLRDQILVEMNAKNAVINWKGRTLVLRERSDPNTGRPTIDLSSMTDMRSWLANRPRIGKETYFDVWLTHPARRQYEGVVFEPTRSIDTHFNLWRGWGVEPKAGDCSLWLAMVRDVICSGSADLFDYVIAWCADAVQNPTNRPGVVLVLRGPQGSGKGTFARVLGKLFGDHFLHIRHGRHLTGNFNAHLANVLLLFADEAYFPGEKSGEGALKGLITEPTIPLEYKGKDVISVNNYLRVLMASNSDWVVPAAMDDRRFAVIDVSREHAQDSEYFGAIYAQLENGGYEALLHHLQHCPLGQVDLRKIPDTIARKEQQEQSLEPFLAFWRHQLQEPSDELEDEKWQPTEKLYKQYASSDKHPLAKNAFGTRLKKLFPNARFKRDWIVDIDTGNRIRAYGYVLPALDAMRKDFERAVGRALDWPNPIQEET
jgi:hypothetical protein